MIVIARGAMPPVLHTIIHGMGYAVVHLEDADVLTARLQEVTPTSSCSIRGCRILTALHSLTTGSAIRKASRCC